MTSNDLRTWTRDELMAAVRTAGELWLSTAGADPYDVLSTVQREQLDHAATAYLTELDDEMGQSDAGSAQRYSVSVVFLHEGDARNPFQSESTAGTLAECAAFLADAERGEYPVSSASVSRPF